MAYYNPYMPQNNGYMNPYINQGMQQQMQQVQNMQPQVQRQEQFAQTQSVFNNSISLQGKSVDSIEVVKAMDIPLDGTISYFPLADGTAIVTKQLQMDGTSKTVIYKPIQEKEINKEEAEKYLTINEFEQKIKQINTNEFKDEIKSIKKQIKEILKEIDEINEDRKD